MKNSCHYMKYFFLHSHTHALSIAAINFSTEKRKYMRRKPLTVEMKENVCEKINVIEYFMIP